MGYGRFFYSPIPKSKNGDIAHCIRTLWYVGVTEGKTRLKTMDFAKGIIMLAIVFAHFSTLMKAMGSSGSGGNPTLTFGYSALILYIIISGYFYNPARMTPRRPRRACSSSRSRPPSPWPWGCPPSPPGRTGSTPGWGPSSAAGRRIPRSEPFRARG